MDDVGLYKLVETILQCVRFIAFGGAIALIFIVVFAPHIMGSKTLHKQLDDLNKNSEQMSEQLRQIARHLEDIKMHNKKKTP